MIEDYLKQVVSLYSNTNSKIKYVGQAGLILAYGKSYPNILKHYYTMGEKKQCYQNSFHLALESNLTYCEGFAVSGGVGIPFEHAWCIDKDENVIDVTWSDGVEYYGIAFSTQFVLKRAEKTKIYGIFGICPEQKWFEKGFNKKDLVCEGQLRKE